MSTYTDQITDDKIASCRTWVDALNLCIAVSGKNLKEIAYEIEIDYNHLSRMLNPEGSRHFPNEKLVPLMDFCGNAIPLRWLALRAGFTLYRPSLKSREELTAQLATEREARRRDRQLMMELIKSIGYAPVKMQQGLTGDHHGLPLMSLKPECRPIGQWLKDTALHIVAHREAA